MEKGDGVKILKRSMVLILVMALGILSFSGLVYYPKKKTLAALDREIERLKLNLAEQEKLRPFYADLKKRLHERKQSMLPLPKQAKLARKNADRLSSVFEKMAGASKLDLFRAAPDVASLEETGRLALDLQLKGPFENFRGFFMRLGGLPYFESIETLGVEAQKEGSVLNMRIRLTLAP